jgi:hypothetical protein
MTSENPRRDPTIAEADQMTAALRDLLASNGLEALEETGLGETWLAEHSGQELVEALIGVAVKASANGPLLVFAGYEVSPGVASYKALVVRRKPEPEDQP